MDFPNEPPLPLAPGGISALILLQGRRTPPFAANTVPPMSQTTKDPLSGRIFKIRGQRVILDADLARLYGVPTKVFNQSIKRNASRFPADFAFQLTKEEFASLKSQIVTSKQGLPMWSQNVTTSKPQRRRLSNLPYAFTEHGAVMAANVLRSPKAVQMSVYVVRAFIMQREALAANATILKRLAEIDKTLFEHDSALRILWKRLQPLLAPPPEKPRRKIGFHHGNR
jgi:hypothetical protein